MALVGKVPRPLVIAPIVKVHVQLIAADHLIQGTGKPNRNRPGAAPFCKLGKEDYKRVIEYSHSNEAVEKAIQYIYYTGCNMDGGCISGITLLNEPKMIGKAKGDFTWEFDVCYALTGPVAFTDLRREVEGIFRHWKWAGDVTYRLKMFQQHTYVDTYVGLS